MVIRLASSDAGPIADGWATIRYPKADYPHISSVPPFRLSACCHALETACPDAAVNDYGIE